MLETEAAESNGDTACSAAPIRRTMFASKGRRLSFWLPKMNYFEKYPQWPPRLCFPDRVKQLKLGFRSHPLSQLRPVPR